MFRKLGFTDQQTWNRVRLLTLGILTFAPLC